MKIFYSNGWYNTDIHADNIPMGAVEVSQDDYESLMAAQSLGRTIQAGENGYPAAVESPGPTADELAGERVARYREVRATADRAIDPLQDLLDGYGAAPATDAEKALLGAWKRYRINLSRLDLAAAELQWPTPPDILTA